MPSDAGVPVRPRQVRVARPSHDLAAATAFYVEALGLPRLGGFADHDGYDGVFVGLPGTGAHLELTRTAAGHPEPTPTVEDLLVLYLPDAAAVQRAAERLAAAGFPRVAPLNPYWERTGAVVVPDPDGYLLVLAVAPDAAP